MSKPRVWLITGASSGFGREMTELVLKKGDIAVATVRKLESLDDLKAKYSPSQFLVLKLDVNNAQDIKGTFVKIKEAFGRLDVVFNNAGYGIMGEIEATPEDAARAVFDTNFWGANNVSLEAVKFFREVNKPVGGRLIVNSSELGVHAVAGLGYLSCSKHALEGITSALAQELDPEWNIKVTLMEPGFFRTAVVDSLVNKAYTHPAYTKPTLPSVAMTAHLVNGQPKGADPSKAVQRVYDLAAHPEPSLRFPLGKDAIGMVREEAQSILKDVAKYESWSEGLEFGA
ncbi:unnamed protein product [Somion occarium]|uniref:NAD(P)-binding protein n=1 Tax=Somion occarium TaxID=3059160 RepID=A0ABP1E0Z1_9APHY